MGNKRPLGSVVIAEMLQQLYMVVGYVFIQNIYDEAQIWKDANFTKKTDKEAIQEPLNKKGQVGSWNRWRF